MSVTGQSATWAQAGIHLGIDATNIRIGGGITHLSQLLEAGDPLEHGIARVTVWTPRATAASLPTRPWLNVRSPAWGERGALSRFVGQHYLLPREARAAACDVLFSPGGTTPLFHTGLRVTMSQNLLPFEPLEAARFGRFSWMRLKMRLLRSSQGHSFRRANGLIFLTAYAQRVVTDMLGSSSQQTALIPHGIEPRFLQPPRPQRSLSDCRPGNPFRLLYVSILMPYKRQHEVAHAVSQLRQSGLPISMTFIGVTWGTYGRRFKALLETLDPKREFLFWPGAEAFDQLHQRYQQADAFVFASSCENLPNILIEAMAAGLPVACSNRGPMPEVLGDAGVYFDPDQIDSMTQGMRTLVEDAALRQQLAQKAWERARAYSWRRCAQDTFKFVAHVAQRAATRVS